RDGGRPTAAGCRGGAGARRRLARRGTPVRGREREWLRIAVGVRGPRAARRGTAVARRLRLRRARGAGRRGAHRAAARDPDPPPPPGGADAVVARRAGGHDLRRGHRWLTTSVPTSRP